jgi:hypothetical protein
MAAKRRPQARRGRKPRARIKSISVSKVPCSKRADKPRSGAIPVAFSTLPRRSSAARTSNLSERSFAARDRALHALADMRRGASPFEAARDNGVTVRTIKKYVGSALLQDRPGGRLRATRSDRLVRYLQIPGLHGPIEIKVHGSKEASDAASYKAAINRFLRGDRHALAPWHGKKIAGVELITAGPTLKSLADTDLLPYSLYRSLSGRAA